MEKAKFHLYYKYEKTNYFLLNYTIFPIYYNGFSAIRQ